MKNIGISALAFILYAVACVYIFHTFLDNSKPEVNQTESLEDSTEKVLKEQEDLRLRDSLNRAEELALANLNPVYKDSTQTLLTEQERLANLTASDPTAAFKPHPFNITDLAGNVKFSCSEYASIYLKSDKVKMPVTCKDYGVYVKEYLLRNAEAKLMIIGSSGIDESPSYGKRRADFIKALILTTGVDGNRIQTAGKVENIVYTFGAAQGGLRMVLIGGVPTKTIKEQNNTNIETAVSKATDPFSYKKFLKGYQGAYYYGDQNATSYIASLKDYLVANPTKKVSVLSYADAIGDEIENFEIAKQNATTMRKLMLEAGIANNRISIVPLGANSSGNSDGKRSLVITVK